MTECNQISFGFTPHFSRKVQADFGGGQISSDGGAVLLRETERRVDIIGRFAACFWDGRHPSFITHEVGEMIRQRVYSLALGYEDLNDQESLRHDPLLGLLAGKRKLGEEPLAGKSTLNRLELSEKEADRYKKIFCDSEAVDRRCFSHCP